MRFTVQRETILTPLQNIIGVVERRQTLPVLSNVLLEVKDDTLSMTTSDLEIEMVAFTNLDGVNAGRITLPARKFMDICRALPEQASIDFKYDEEKQRVTIRSGRSRFNLTTLPADDFPNIEEIESGTRFSIPQGRLGAIIEKTHFSMAQQDVRYYLNGLLLEIANNRISAVATDGHRLAYCETDTDINPDEVMQVIIPRKGVVELARLLDENDEPVELIIGSNHIRISLPQLIITSKLIDGQFPDYNRVIPEGNQNIVTADKDTLRQALARASILSNEKYRGIRIKISSGVLQAQANNPEMEEAEEEIEVSYEGPELEIGFNVNYLLEAISAVTTDRVNLAFGDASSSCLITQEGEQGNCRYVVMPMRL